jgi:putative addiction module antidote
MQVKLRKIGNSIGATFPKEVLDRFGLKEGDELNLILTAEGIQLMPYDPNFKKMMEAYKEGGAKYRNAMRQLADG